MRRAVAAPTRFPAQRVAGAMALAVGFVLMAMAWPRAVAYFDLAGWAAAVPDALNEGDFSIDDRQLAVARADYCAAAARHSGDAFLHQECARLGVWLASAARDETETRALFDEAAAALRRAVERAPNRAFGWSLLAAVEGERATLPADMDDFLRMSYLIGPHEASNMILRVRLVLSKWETMPDDLREAAARDVRALWKIPALREPLVRIYLASDFRRRALIRRHALVSDDDVGRFDHLLGKVSGIAPLRRPASR